MICCALSNDVCFWREGNVEEDFLLELVPSELARQEGEKGKCGQSLHEARKTTKIDKQDIDRKEIYFSRIKEAASIKIKRVKNKYDGG